MIRRVGENSPVGHNVRVEPARARAVADDESSRLPKPSPKNLVCRNRPFSALHWNDQTGSGLPHSLVHCVDDSLLRLSVRQRAITMKTSHLRNRCLPAENSQTDPYESQHTPYSRTPDGRLQISGPAISPDGKLDGEISKKRDGKKKAACSKLPCFGTKRRSPETLQLQTGEQRTEIISDARFGNAEGNRDLSDAIVATLQECVQEDSCCTIQPEKTSCGSGSQVGDHRYRVDLLERNVLIEDGKKLIVAETIDSRTVAVFGDRCFAQQITDAGFPHRALGPP